MQSLAVFGGAQGNRARVAFLAAAFGHAGVERRVNLSSVRAPRMGSRDRQPEPWAVEAKEFLRCVGRRMHVHTSAPA